MEIITILGFAVLIFLLQNLKNEITTLRRGLDEALDQLISIRQTFEDKQEDTLEPVDLQPDLQLAEAPITVEEEHSIPIEVDAVPAYETDEPIEQHIVAETTYPTEELLPSLPEPTFLQEVEDNDVYVQEEDLVPELDWFERFRRDNPDIEKFIGENLINKIGIIILVLGISYFVKYAIDRDWINEPGRVGIGILSGGILLGIAHRLRAKFKAFSSVLVAGAISVFYFTMGIAFHDYGLFSQTVAFTIMVCIMLFSVFVSLAYKRQELAILATIAGFAVPFMVSTGQTNYHVLLTYLCILNCGILTMSYFKRWFILNFTAFILTFFIVLGWYALLKDSSIMVQQHTLIYSSLFYLIFNLAFIINNIRQKTKFTNYEIFAVIINNAAYYGIGYQTVHIIAPQYAGLFTLGIGIFNLLSASFIYKRYKLDKNIIYVLIGLALTFTTLTIPVQFEGNYITIFWACEAILLFWLTNKTKLYGFVVGAIIVQWLSVLSLFIDLVAYPNKTVAFVLGFNSTFITGLTVIGTFLFTYRMLKKHAYVYTFVEFTFDPVFYRKILYATVLLFAYFLPIIEISYQAKNFFSNSATINFFPYLYHMLYSTILIYYIQNRSSSLRAITKVLIIVNMAAYLLIVYRLPLIEKMQALSSNSKDLPLAFLFHYISLLLLLSQTWTFIKTFLFEGEKLMKSQQLWLWFIGFFIVYLCSSELNIICLINTVSKNHYNETFSMVIRALFPILWGLLSFIFLTVGIKRNLKIVRIIALTLLGITIAKLFLFDISEISETGKIIAFILLGALILVISFVYQKIKNLVVDTNEQTDD
ncbi:DUF2339 domain-containing protein [Sphingobacterium sp. MYb382]|uniref:DUF2339 domain-containing protein n=1 Tax=Sphingobacterium sp. MYb382 TaxID=2745278 RepID=UPI00309A27A4